MKYSFWNDEVGKMEGNYTLYIIAAYLVALLPLAWMFVVSHKKYQRLKREMARVKANAKPQQRQRMK